jgi:hypothetical protein
MRVSGFVRFMAAPLVLLLLLGALFSASFFAYSNLTDETQIAELSFKQLGEDEYLVNLATGDFCDVRSFIVRGDQWRLDANFLKWKYWASALGLESQYRLDRLEGRFSDINVQNGEPTLAHKLGEPTLLDIARLADDLGRFSFFADAAYGSSTFQQIDDTRIYDVYKTPTGIMTRAREHPGFDLQEDVLSIEINHACATPPDAWMQFSFWFNDLMLDATE